MNYFRTLNNFTADIFRKKIPSCDEFEVKSKSPVLLHLFSQSCKLKFEIIPSSDCRQQLIGLI